MLLQILCTASEPIGAPTQYCSDFDTPDIVFVQTRHTCVLLLFKVCGLDTLLGVWTSAMIVLEGDYYIMLPVTCLAAHYILSKPSESST